MFLLSAKPRSACRVLLLTLACHGALRTAAVAQTARNTVLEVTATTAPSVPHVTLNWITPGGVTVTAQKLWKRQKGTTSWGTAITLGAGDTSYADPTALPGVAYEYSLQRTRSGTPATVYGAIVAGYNLPLVESRGNVCLLVDATMSVPLAPELGQLDADLTADGWTVFRHDVPRAVVSSSSTNSADWPTRISEQSAIRALVQADYNTAPGANWALLIVGRIPVPYSGLTAPDGHSNHVGAWPTDAHYGDIDGTWTDTSVNNTSASDARNDNVPGDGKFDHSSFPSAIEMQVGRVDMANMGGVPTGQTETGLLRQYLVRNHRFRCGEGPYVSVQLRGLFDDNFGYFYGEAFSSSSWRAAMGFFGRDLGQVDALDWFGTLGTTPVLFAYGCGGGSYTSASGVGTSTLGFGRLDSKAVFTELFGSYFGDWDVSNNFLRSPLAGTQDSLGLTCMWSGRSHIHKYHMALGETVGYGVRYTQNSNGSTASGDWFQNGYVRGVQTNLMGDPTLRLHTVRPPSGLVATSGAGSVELSWQHSPDPIMGYHVYRAVSPAGPYTRLTGGTPTAADPLGAPSSNRAFTDNSVVAGTTYYYSVKAGRIESSASGTYANQSVGETVVITHNGPAPPAPTRLMVTGAAATTFNLSWDDNATNETGYEVQRRDETTGVWNLLVALGPNATSYVDSAAVAGMPNHYRVRALGATANSDFSAEVADPNQPGIARISEDYTLVAESAGTLNYPITRFSGSHGAASVGWSTADVVSFPADYTGTSGSVSWLHGQSGVQNINLGITNYVPPQLTKVFRVNLGSPSGCVLGSPTAGYVQIYDPTVQGVPAPWSSQTVGTVTQAGYSEHHGSFGISAVTGNISGTADSFRGIHQQVNGNCRITARVSARSTAASSTRAGIMIRAGLSGDAVMCAAVMTSGTAIQRAFRSSTAGTADTALTQSSLTLPLWLQLTRTGDDVSLEHSSNGTSWTSFGTAVPLTGLGASPYVALVMASNTTSPAIYGYARFDNVSVYFQPPAPGIAAAPGTQPGQIAVSWAASPGAETYVIERSTTSGSGFAQIAQVSTPGYTDPGLAIAQTYYYRVRADNVLYQSAFSTEAEAAPYDPPTMDGWRYRNFGTTSNTGDAADLADPDDDGLLNLFEGTFGRPPLAPSPEALPVPGLATVDGSPRLTLSFIRDTTLTGVVLQAESAATLSGPWTQFDPLAPANQLSVQSDTPAPGLETITIKDVQGVAPGESRFMRLRVTRP